MIPAGGRTVIQSDSSAPNSAWTEGQEKALEEIVIKAKRIVGPIGDEVGATMGASLLLPASVIHGATQFASDQVWTSLNLLTGNVLAEKNSSARDAVARNNALVQSLVALPEKASAMALRAMTGNWRGMDPLNLDQVNALNAKGDILGAKVLFGQSALNAISVATGVAGVVRGGVLAGSTARSAVLAAEDVAQSKISSNNIGPAAIDVGEVRGVGSPARGERTRFLTMDEIDQVKSEWTSLGGDPSVLAFNRRGMATGYGQESGRVFINGDVFSTTSDSLHPTATLSVRETLAHEMGHMAHPDTSVAIGAWNDEFRASY